MAQTLALWSPTADTALPGGTFDWGPVPQRSSADVTFRVRNTATTKTATAVTVALAGSGAAPTPASQHLLSADGQTFTASLTLGDLLPGQTSPVLTLRRVTASAAALGAATFTVVAAAASWA